MITPILVLRNGVAWIFTACFFSLLLPIYIVTFRSLPDEWMVAAHRFWGRVTAKLLGVEFEFQNPSTVLGKEARIIMANHQGGLDLVWPAMICTPGILVIGKKEIIYVPIFNLVWWAYRFIRIDRKNPRKAIEKLRGVAAEILKNKRSMWVAPEGTRTRDGNILPFKKGAFHIALEGRIPIYPIVVSGEFQLLPRGALIPRPGKVKIRYLPRVDTTHRNLDQLEDLINEVRGAMVKAKEEMDQETLRENRK